MEIKKVYLVKSLSPWMMDELLAFSSETRFTLWLLRKPGTQYKNDLNTLEARGVEVILKPYSLFPEIGRILFIIRFIFSNFSKLTAGYSAVLGWKSIYWFLKLDARFLKEELSIHAQFATQAALIAALIRQYGKAPLKYYFTFHAYDIYFNNKWFSTLVNNSEFAFSISEFNKRYVSDRFNQVNTEKLSLSRLGADTSQNQKSRNDSPKFRIGFMGRLVEKKGIIYLLEAMKILQQEQAEIHLTLAGEGPLATDINDFIYKEGLNNVSLSGQLQGLGKEDFYKNLDAFVMPSVQLKNDMDGIPVVMMEAVANHLPLIASNVSGLPEICRNGCNGILVPQADAKELAGAIRYLHQHPKECSKLAEQSEMVFKEFNIQINSANKLKTMMWLN